MRSQAAHKAADLLKGPQTENRRRSRQQHDSKACTSHHFGLISPKLLASCAEQSHGESRGLQDVGRRRGRSRRQRC